MRILGKFPMLTTAAILSLLGCLTAWRPDWIETAIGLDPDAGSGSLEWALVFLPAAIAAAGALAAYRKWSHARLNHHGAING